MRIHDKSIARNGAWIVGILLTLTSFSSGVPEGSGRNQKTPIPVGNRCTPVIYKVPSLSEIPSGM
jgi:hypothetical protein